MTTGAASMLTCPNCHHVLAAQSCCGVSFQTANPQQLCPPMPPHAAPHSSGPGLPVPPTSQHHLQPSSLPSSTTLSASSSSSSSSSINPSPGEIDGGNSYNLGPRQQPNQPQLQMGASLGPTPLNVNNPNPFQPMTTPHISGHMFHFPTPHVPAIAACQGACHMTCHPAMHTPCVGSCWHTPCSGPAANPWRWPDSAGHMAGQTLTTRMHTSGGGIVEDSISDKTLPADIAKRLNGLKDWTAWDDERVLSNMKRCLAQSGWYWDRLSWRQAEALLQSTRLGTFIVRESADTRYLYSLSVQTEKGPTSVRIHYTSGKFRLDCESHMTSSIPDFSSIFSLIEYYIRVSRKLQTHVWVDTHGKMYSPITIRQPLMRSVPTLKHLSRLAINMSLPKSCSLVRLPPALSQYIDEYPYWC